MQVLSRFRLVSADKKCKAKHRHCYAHDDSAYQAISKTRNFTGDRGEITTLLLEIR